MGRGKVAGGCETWWVGIRGNIPGRCWGGLNSELNPDGNVGTSPGCPREIGDSKREKTGIPRFC